MPSGLCKTGGHGMPPKIRTITFVDRLTLDFRGNVSQNALCLADVDGDQENEFVIGTSDGLLAIFKGANTRPWRVSAERLGHITAITSGDLCNLGTNVLVVITADGFIHLYDSTCMAGTSASKQAATAANQTFTGSGNTANTLTSGVDSCDESMPLSSATTPSTPTTQPQQVLSTDVSPQPGTPLEKSSGFGSGSNVDLTSSASGSGNVQQILPIFTQRIPANVKAAMIQDVDGDGFNELVLTLTDRVVRTYHWHHTGDIFSSKTMAKGHLISRNKWEFACQIGSTSLHRDDQDRPLLLISQPGGAFLRLRVPVNRPAAATAAGAADPDRDDEQDSLELVQTFEPLILSNLRNCNVTTEIQGGFCGRQTCNIDIETRTSHEQEQQGYPFAMATLDGQLLFARNDEVLWSLQLNHHLFCLNKMDLDEDGRDELVVSSWDGHTYIVTQDCRAVEFVFEESILAFTCGNFTVEDETVAVLVYVTCAGKIFLYYNIKMPKDLEMKTLPEEVNIESANIELTPELVRYLLYAPFDKMKKLKS